MKTITMTEKEWKHHISTWVDSPSRMKLQLECEAQARRVEELCTLLEEMEQQILEDSEAARDLHEAQRRAYVLATSARKVMRSRIIDALRGGSDK